MSRRRSAELTRREQPCSVWLLLCTLLSAAWPSSHARAEWPSFLRKENVDVHAGNLALNKGDAKSAQSEYEKAARALPEEPGVQLNRGLSLLKQGEYAKARESLLAATVPNAPNASSDVRADAYRNLALSFYREADGLAGQDKHADAQKLFRESVDASKRSLHLRPNDSNTAWNLELAQRRVREEDDKRKQQEEQQKQEQQKNQNQDQKSGDQHQDQDKKPDQNQDQDANNPDQNKSDQDQKQQDQNAEPKPDSDKQDQQDKQPKPDESKQAPEPNADEQNQAAEPQLPREAEQALDSLEDSEENFERYRAHQRAQRERRPPEKDW